MNRIYRDYIVISILSIWAVGASAYGLKLYGDPLILTNSIFSVLACAGIWVLLKKTSEILNRRLLVCAGTAGLLFAGMLVIGTEVYQESIYSVWINLFAVLGLMPVFTAVSALVMYYYDRALLSIRGSFLESMLVEKLKVLQRKMRHPFLVVCGLIMLCWIPGLLATFPGIYAYDSVFQMKWFVNGEISGHHPILHTYMLGGCLTLGEKVFGSYEAGMLIYSLIQMLFMAAVFAYIVRYIGRFLPRVLQVFVFALYVFLPYNVLFSFSATKDVIFAGLFAVLVLKSYEMVRDMETFFAGWKNSFVYVGLAFMMCAFRNNGYYAFLCVIPVMLIVCRRYWKKAMLICLIVVLCWNVYVGPVYQLLGVTKGSTAEMLSVPMQQLSYVMCTDPSELTVEERNQIEAYIPEYWKYGSSVSDYVKDAFNSELFDKDPVKFVKLWLSVGIKYPASYVEAFLRLNLGFWYPDMVYPDPGAWHPYIEYVNSEMEGDWVQVGRTSLIPPLSKFYEKFAYETIHQKVPVVSLLFQPGVTFWGICLGIMLCIYKKNYKMAVPFGLMIGLWLTLMLSPVVLLRYAYPLMVSMPIVLCICRTMEKEVVYQFEEGEGNE